MLPLLELPSEYFPVSVNVSWIKDRVNPSFTLDPYWFEIWILSLSDDILNLIPFVSLEFTTAYVVTLELLFSVIVLPFINPDIVKFNVKYIFPVLSTSIIEVSSTYLANPAASLPVPDLILLFILYVVLLLNCTSSYSDGGSTFWPFESVISFLSNPIEKS